MAKEWFEEILRESKIKEEIIRDYIEIVDRVLLSLKEEINPSLQEKEWIIKNIVQISNNDEKVEQNIIKNYKSRKANLENIPIQIKKLTGVVRAQIIKARNEEKESIKRKQIAKEEEHEKLKDETDFRYT